MTWFKKLSIAAGLACLLTAGLSAPAQAAGGEITSLQAFKDETRLPSPNLRTAPIVGEGTTQTSPTGATNPVVMGNGYYKMYVNYSKVAAGRTVKLYLNGTQIAQQVASARGAHRFEVWSPDLLRYASTGWNTLTTSLSSRQFQVFYLPPSAGISVYHSPGQHMYNNRYWRTACERYSKTVRCTTYTRYSAANPWVFNNLTYLPAMTRAEWGTNPLARTGTWTSGGRSWRTECDTPVTGRNGCRSYIRTNGSWVFNSMVQFKS